MTFAYALRVATAADAATIATHRFHDAWGDDGRLVSMRAAYADWLAGLFASGRYVGHVAESEGSIVAGAGAVLLDWGATWVDPNPVKARLANVFTSAAHRRQGLARELTQRTLASLREQGITSVSLASTEEGRSLYESLGFQLRRGEFGLLLR